MEKKQYEKIKDIRSRIEKGEKTTFQERNIVNIIDKKKKKSQNDAVRSSNK
jgi:hypothetical protein